jgi:hypothetical protein
MNDGWTDIFYEKMKTFGIVCGIKFRRSHIREGKRKNSKPFWCRAVCTGSKCTRSYFITLENKPNVHTAALFMMEISGIENHDPESEVMSRQLRGVERFRVGKKSLYYF